MKLYGNLRGLVALFFSRDTFEVGVQPNANTYVGTTTFSLPPQTTGAGVLVSEAGTQTLTNKTLTSPTINTPTVTGGTITVLDANLTIQDNVDPTKQAQFQASGITTATTRTYTLPNATDTLVGATFAQTLTTKTITAPIFNTDTVFTDIATPTTPAAGLTKLYSKAGLLTYLTSAGVERVIANTTDALTNPMTTQGDTIYGGASGVATRLPAGSVGQIFQTNGVAAPSWVSAVNLNGTVANPTYAGTGANSNTGSYVDSTDVWNVASNGTLTMTISSTGASTVGPAVTGNITGQRHIISGFLYAGNVTSTVSSGNIGFGTNVRYSGNNAQDGRTNATTGGFGLAFNNDTSATNPGVTYISNAPGDTTGTSGANVGTISHAGSYTWGPATTNNFNGQRHIVNGFLYAGNVTSTSDSGNLGVGTNVRFAANNAQTGRTDTTSGGFGIVTTNATSATSPGLNFISNAPGDATSTSGINVGTIFHNGQHTVGPTTAIGGSTFPGPRIVGTTNATVVPAGYIGQVDKTTAVRLVAAALSVTSAATNNVTASPLVLTPGNYKLSGFVGYNGTTTTATLMIASISTTSATLGSADDSRMQTSAVASLTAAANTLTLVDLYVEISASTTYYLTARVDFTGGTANVFGRLQAHRVG